MKGFGFSKTKHIVKTDEISSVFSFNCRFSSGHFQVLVKPGQCEHARFAVIVSKKTARLATTRNYIKRIAREIFRLGQNQLVGLDIVVRVRKRFIHSDYEEVSQELLVLLNRARQSFPQSQAI